MNKSRIVIVGGSGFIGSALAANWQAQNGETIVLTRSPRERNDGVIEVKWDGTHSGDWIKYLDGAEAVIGLAGKNINCRHTPKAVRELTESRVNAVRAIGFGIDQVQVPPRVWVQASAIGFYGNRGDVIVDEDSPGGDGPLADICREWETAFESANVLRTRKVLLRIGFVLGRTGGALPVLARLTKWFLGGRAGDGKQYISWIHLADLTRMFWESVSRTELTGTFNAVGPAPVTNNEFMKQLRRALHRPWSPPVPKWALKAGARLMGTEPALALDGCRVMPKRFRESSFRFHFSDIGAALQNFEF